MTLRVPLVDLRAEIAAVREEIDAAIARVIDSAEFIGGAEVAQLEAELVEHVGARHVITTSSGSDALHVIGMALGVSPGDEIVTTPFTFFSTAGSFARLGARIVFADIDEATLNLDPRLAATACTNRTRAVVPVHLFGLPAAIPDVPVPVIEDAAQSIGSGPLRGRAAALSFFPTKNLGAFGDGGAVATDDAALADAIRRLRNHGAQPKYHHLQVGGNFRLDALQAAVLRVKLRHLNARIDARRAAADRYCALFAAASMPPEIRLPVMVGGHVYHHFVIRTPRRDRLRDHLREQGIGSEVYYPGPLHLQPAFADLGLRRGSLPHAEAASEDVLALPVHPFLSARSQELVVAEISRFFSAS